MIDEEVWAHVLYGKSFHGEAGSARIVRVWQCIVVCCMVRQVWIGTELHGMVRYGGAGLERFGLVRKSRVRCGLAGMVLRSLVML